MRMRMSANVPQEALDPHGDDADEIGPFVLNLCTVDGPLEIPQPRWHNLVKYAFFVSRGVEADRECFCLHMGYFESRAEAQKWLEVLARIYPLAFVTSAPVTFVPLDETAETDVAPRPE